MTLFNPGHSSPQVTIAARVLRGSKKISSRVPTSRTGYQRANHGLCRTPPGSEYVPDPRRKRSSHRAARRGLRGERIVRAPRRRIVVLFRMNHARMHSCPFDAGRHGEKPATPPHELRPTLGTATGARRRDTAPWQVRRSGRPCTSIRRTSPPRQCGRARTSECGRRA